MQYPRRVACLGVVLALMQLATASATPQAQFGTSTEVLRIQVGIVDAEGNPVTGLQKEDLQLLIGGQPRQILDLYEVDASELGISADALAHEAPPPPVDGLQSTTLRPTTGAELPSAARRRFLLFFDLGFMSRRGLGYARGAAESFLKDVAQGGDLVGMATYSAFRGLQYHVPFTSDRDQILAAVERLNVGRSSEAIEQDNAALDLQGLALILANSPLGDAGGSDASIAAELASTRQALEGGRVIMALERLAEEVAPIQGRKHIVYFSQGIPDALMTGLEDGSALLQDMMIAMESARRSDVVIHSFMPAAMPDSGVHDIREMTPQGGGGNFRVLGDRSYLNYAAGETGGFSVYFRHQLRRGLNAMEEATRSYYVLSFPLAPSDREAVDLRVVPQRAGVSVAWAPARLSVPDWQEHSVATRQLQIADALEIGNDARSMALDVMAIRTDRRNGYGRVAVAGEIPAQQLRDLVEERGDDSLDLEVLGLALRPNGEVADYFRTHINLDEVGAQLERVSIPLRYQNILVVEPGAYFVKVLVREGSVSRLASRSLRVEIPASDPDGMNISTPLVVTPASNGRVIQGVDPANPPSHRMHLPLDYPFVVGAQELVPAIHPASVAGADIDVYVTVQNPSRHPFTGDTDILAETWLQDADGNRFVLSDFRPLASTFDETTSNLRMLLRLSLSPSLPSGAYFLVVQTHDRISGEAVGSYADLVIEPAFEAVR